MMSMSDFGAVRGAIDRSAVQTVMNATLRHEDVSFLSMVVEVQSFHIVPSHRARAELMKRYSH